MTPNEITPVLEIATELWPKFEPNKEQQNVWFMALRGYSADEAIGAFREHAAYSKFIPRPAEIAARCRAHRDQHARVQSDESRLEADARLQAEIEADRLETDTIIDAMSREEFDRHIASAIAADWRLEWLASAKDFETAKAIVAARIISQLGPDDAESLSAVPDRLPPGKRAKNELFTRRDPVKSLLREWKAAGYTEYDQDEESAKNLRLTLDSTP